MENSCSETIHMFEERQCLLHFAGFHTDLSSFCFCSSAFLQDKNPRCHEAPSSKLDTIFNIMISDTLEKHVKMSPHCAIKTL